MMRSLIISRMASGILAGILLKGKIGLANVRLGRLKPGHKDETTMALHNTYPPSRDLVETLKSSISKYFRPSLGRIIVGDDSVQVQWEYSAPSRCPNGVQKPRRDVLGQACCSICECVSAHVVCRQP